MYWHALIIAILTLPACAEEGADSGPPPIEVQPAPVRVAVEVRNGDTVHPEPPYQILHCSRSEAPTCADMTDNYQMRDGGIEFDGLEGSDKVTVYWWASEG